MNTKIKRVNKIKKVTLITGVSFEVGKDCIIDIVDSSLEYETMLHTRYDAIDKHGNLLFTLLQGVSTVQYYK